MKSYLVKIAENLALGAPTTVLVQLWGDAEDSAQLSAFVEALKPHHTHVEGLLFDKDTVAAECKKGPYTRAFKAPEVVIDLCKYAPTSLVAACCEKGREHFIHFMRNHFATITAPGKRLIQIRIPSEANAQEAGLDKSRYEAIWKEMIDTDYSDMRTRGEAAIEQYKAAHSIQIESGGSCCLTLETAGRPWHLDAGDGDFPAGEIYTAPIETSAEGTYCVDEIFWEGKRFKNVILTFKGGRLIDATEPQIMSDLAEADDNAFVLAEFGLGLNLNHQTVSGYSLFDEKIAGSCHIAVGMNTLFGGTNDSMCHIDFVARKPKITFNK